MQCVVQCMIVHEWNIWTFKFIFHLNLFYSSFIFPRLNKCEMQILCPWPCQWNTMIGFTNVICKRCALTCYWQALNHWPRCQFSMNAKCDASLDFSFLMQMLSNKDANAIFMMQMSRVGMKLQSLFMMLVRVFIPWCKCLFVKMEMQRS